MRSKGYIIVGLLALAFVGALLYGVGVGDALYVFKNASNFCFT
jgi:hypothetical protein